MSRISRFTKYSGTFPHREHRSKKGRNISGSKKSRCLSIRKKIILQKLREKDLYENT